jgi:hypothetical protein
LKCATSQDPIDRHAKERIKELLVRKCAHVVQEHLPELLRYYLKNLLFCGMGHYNKVINIIGIRCSLVKDPVHQFKIT